MEKYARYALLHQDQRFKIAVREYQRPARDAVNQAERSSENNEGTMFQEVQGVQNR